MSSHPNRRPLGPRAAAARVLARVLERGESLATAFPDVASGLPPAERGLAQELCYGVLRWLPRLQAMATGLMERPLKPKEGELKSLLLVGLYQLAFLDLKPHAAVSETVAAVDALDRSWARGLTNAVLRGFQRRRAELESSIEEDDDVRLAHPRWLLDLMRTGWPEAWEQAARAANERPPMVLRVNLSRCSRAEYLSMLAQAGIGAGPTAFSPAGIRLERPLPVDQLPGFAEGAVSVQDEAPQLAPSLLDLEPGQRVLDACAAPGGKTGHLLESCPALELTALDVDRARLARVQENLSRLRFSARLIAGDAAEPGEWWDGRPFDRILIDAPCSGTGVIRRHPDIKWLRRPEDIPNLAALQARILRALFPLLSPGGLLVYATCSILPEENSQQIEAFMNVQGDARPLPIEAAWGRAAGPGRQLLPGENGMDGFFFARIGRT